MAVAAVVLYAGHQDATVQLRALLPGDSFTVPALSALVVAFTTPSVRVELVSGDRAVVAAASASMAFTADEIYLLARRHHLDWIIGKFRKLHRLVVHCIRTACVVASPGRSTTARSSEQSMLLVSLLNDLVYAILVHFILDGVISTCLLKYNVRVRIVNLSSYLSINSTPVFLVCWSDVCARHRDLWSNLLRGTIQASIGSLSHMRFL